MATPRRLRRPGPRRRRWRASWPGSERVGPEREAGAEPAPCSRRQSIWRSRTRSTAAAGVGRSPSCTASSSASASTRWRGTADPTPACRGLGHAHTACPPGKLRRPGRPSSSPRTAPFDVGLWSPQASGTGAPKQLRRPQPGVPTPPGLDLMRRLQRTSAALTTPERVHLAEGEPIMTATTHADTNHTAIESLNVVRDTAPRTVAAA